MCPPYPFILKNGMAFSDSELQTIRSDLLQIAVDCFRQCGNMERDCQSVTVSQQRVQNQ